MRKFYKNRRNRIVTMLKICPFAGEITILEQDAGLHFLVQVNTALPVDAVNARIAAAGMKVRSLADYYHLPDEQKRHCFVVNYSVLDESALENALKRLAEVD